MKKTAEQIAYRVLLKLAREEEKSWAKRHPYLTAGLATAGLAGLGAATHFGLKRFRGRPVTKPAASKPMVQQAPKPAAPPVNDPSNPSLEDIWAWSGAPRGEMY